jgi:hypothetical protein
VFIGFTRLTLFVASHSLAVPLHYALRRTQGIRLVELGGLRQSNHISTLLFAHKKEVTNNMTNNTTQSCPYGLHGAPLEDMRTAHNGDTVCKDCLEDYDNHDAFSACSCGFRDHSKLQLDEWCLALQESGRTGGHGRECMHTPRCQPHEHTQRCINI